MVINKKNIVMPTKCAYLSKYISKHLFIIKYYHEFLINFLSECVELIMKI